MCADPRVSEVFEFWRETMGKKMARLTPERTAKIKKRLSEGYSVQDLKHAIMGCADSPFHMGVNDSGTLYNDLTLILRNGSKVEQFCEKRRTRTPQEMAEHKTEGERLRLAIEAVEKKNRAEEMEYAEKIRKAKEEQDRKRQSAKSQVVEQGRLL